MFFKNNVKTTKKKDQKWGVGGGHWHNMAAFQTSNMWVIKPPIPPPKKKKKRMYPLRGFILWSLLKLARSSSPPPLKRIDIWPLLHLHWAISNSSQWSTTGIIKAFGIYHFICRQEHIKDPLLLIVKSNPCGGSGFPLSLFVWRHITVNKLLSASLNKTFPSFLPVVEACTEMRTQYLLAH